MAGVAVLGGQQGLVFAGTEHLLHDCPRCKGLAWSYFPILCSRDGEHQDQDAHARPRAQGTTQSARHVGTGTPEKNGCALVLLASP